MTAISRFERPTVAVAIGLPCLTSLVLMFWAPGAIAPTTYAVLAALLLAISAVAITTWKNAQGTGSVGQMLHETEVGPAPEPQARTRWERWLSRYDKSAALGRREAVLALSTVVTLVIIWAWLA